MLARHTGLKVKKRLSLFEPLIAEADELMDIVWVYGFLEHEGGYVGAGDGQGLWGQVTGGDAGVASGGAVEQARGAEDGPVEIGLGHLVVAVSVVVGHVFEEGVGHDGVE